MFLSGFQLRKFCLKFSVKLNAHNYKNFLLTCKAFNELQVVCFKQLLPKG